MSVDIHSLSGPYAVDALDDIERARFERHLADCAACHAEVDSLREAAALLPATSELAPPPHLRDAILAGITAVRPIPPVVVAVSERSRSTRRRFPALVAAAAALIAIGGAGATVWHPWSDDSQVQPDLSATERVIQAPDAERVLHQFDGGGTATVVRSKSLNQAVIVTDDMASAPVGHTYELWLQDDGVMIPAGQIAGGSNTVLLDGDAASAEGVGITVELAGVEPSEPTLPPFAAIGFEQA